ncbi:hypothetical protein Syun_015530 [Stephania yunnanensis]|uniref:Cytochrome P450 n=1 Tax=Stephania yunnanensis TaxID=152371 RepID=A0AAP0JNK4_9MAGN
MNSTNQIFSPPTLVFSLATILLYFLYILFSKPKQTNNKPPQAPGAWPIIGHLHKLSGDGLPHMILGAMADQHGPVFTLLLGTKQALVVSNWEVAKECFTTNDRAFASRPNPIALKIMGYNNAFFGFNPDGPYWRELRKIVVLELLSNRRLESLKHIWISEIDASMKELYDAWTSCTSSSSSNNYNSTNKDNSKSSHVLVEMKQWFGDLAMNIVVRLVAGKRWFGRNVAGSADEGYRKEMRSVARDLDVVLQGWLEEHKLNRLSCGDEVNKVDHDFMDVMLSVLKDATILTTDRDADTVNKATCLKAQEELTAQVGNDRHVDESDIDNLVYLQAIVKEVMRLYPAGPLSGPRESIEDAMVAGYRIPAGTRLIVNLWKIQRDPSIWTDPLEFRPERFLTTHKKVDVWGQHYELIPFGAGRRVCPGVSFALQVVTLTLARLLHGFELKTPNGEPVDMTEGAGLANVKATPLEVLLAPKLPLHLYQP